MQQRQGNQRQTAQIVFKVIMVGDSGTGKSCVMTRYIKNQFTEDYHVTIGTEFDVKTIMVDDNYQVKLQIWDTAGQQTFRSIVRTFYRSSGAVLLVYNIANRKSFANLDSWFTQAKENSPKSAIFVLIATHLDLQDKRQVPKEQAEAWVTKNSINMFFETSAKADINITKCFEEIARQLFFNQLSKRKHSTSVMAINDDKTIISPSKLSQVPAQGQPQKKGCCG